MPPGSYRAEGERLLKEGKFTEGFALIAKEPGFFRSDEFYKLPPEKRLVPRTDISGKRVLLALEGGFGDEVAFARYAQILNKRGAHVTIGALPASVSTLSRMLGADDAKDMRTITPEEYDYHLLGMDAIQYFAPKNGGEGIIFPYLTPSEAYMQRVAPEIEKFSEGNLKIGIHWRGNKDFEQTEQKSYMPELLFPLAEFGTLFSLQRDAGEFALPPDAPVIDTQQGPADWEQTLAVIASMDVVVTGCTSTAHYAGALGKPVILIIKHAPSYYWADTYPSEDGTHELSKWYPSMRIFRQESAGDWESAHRKARQYFRTHLHEFQKGMASTGLERHIHINAIGGLGDHITAEPVIRYMKEVMYPDADISISALWPRPYAHLGIPLHMHNTFVPEKDVQYENVWTLPDRQAPLMRAANFLLCHMADFHALAMLHRQLPEEYKQIKLSVLPEERASLMNKIGADPSEFIAVHPGKSWRTKTFPQAWWQEVVDGLSGAGMRVALIGKSASHVQGDATGVVPLMVPTNGVDLTDKLTLGELFALIEGAPVLLTNDSSPVQIAGAFNNYIAMIATVKPPDLVFPIRNGSPRYKTRALFKRLLNDDMPFDPLRGGSMSVDFEVTDWSKYLPEPAVVVSEVVKMYTERS